MAVWLQGQGSVTHFYVAPRVANRLDTGIRVLSRKLREQMTPGSGRGRGRERGSSRARHWMPAIFPWFCPLWRATLRAQGIRSKALLERALSCSPSDWCGETCECEKENSSSSQKRCLLTGRAFRRCLCVPEAHATQTGAPSPRTGKAGSW